MICPTCNQQIPDGSAFCPACGATFAAPQPPYQPAPAPIAKKAPNKKLLSLVAIVLVAAIALGAVFFLFGGASGAAGVVEKSFDVQLDRNDFYDEYDSKDKKEVDKDNFIDDYKSLLEARFELYPQFYIDKLVKDAECDSFDEYLDKSAKALWEEYQAEEESEESDDDDIEYSYEILDLIVEIVYNDETNKGDFRDKVKAIKEYYGLKESEADEIEEIVRVAMVGTESYEKEGKGEVIDVETDTYECIKYQGDWYLMPYYSTSED